MVLQALVLPFVCVAGCFLLLNRRWRYQQYPPLPPGPPGWPLVGNAFDWPDINKQVDTFTKWAKQYGPLVHLNNMGYPIIIISASAVASDLLTQRSINYSSRPTTTMLRKFTGYSDWLLPFIPYNNRWRVYRKHFHLAYRVQEVEAMHDSIAEICSEFLQCLSSDPAHFRAHIRAYSGKVFSKLAFGHEHPMSSTDPLIEPFNVVVEEFNDKLFGNLFMVDLFPFLRHIPSNWLGGAAKQLGLRQRKRLTVAINDLYERLKSEMEEGVADTCVVTRSINDVLQASGQLLPEQEDLFKHNAATSLIAGADSVSSLLATFFLAMSIYPEYQDQAQAEIDSVTERTRQPTFEDKKFLPFIDVLLLECLRWHPPVPPVPRRSFKEDIYNGMRIPAGSIIFANIGEILGDPNHFENPQEFNPNRFFDAQGNKRADLELLVMNAFGFGRRICPGRHLALDIAWITFASTLSSFTIRKALGEDGKEVDPPVMFTAGLSSHPVPFDCRITPREET